MAKVIKKKKKEEANVEVEETKAGRGKKAAADSGGKAKKAAPGKKGNGKKGKATKADDLTLTQEFIDDINETIEEMQEEFEKSIKNASAARRVRKLSTELAKKFKEFRSVSVAHHKK